MHSLLISVEKKKQILFLKVIKEKCNFTICSNHFTTTSYERFIIIGQLHGLHEKMCINNNWVSMFSVMLWPTVIHYLLTLKCSSLDKWDQSNETITDRNRVLITAVKHNTKFRLLKSNLISCWLYRQRWTTRGYNV